MTEQKRDGFEPVVKRVKVDLVPQEAFRLFTEGIHRWWPLRRHAVDEKRAVSCVFEQRRGGRLYEVYQDGGQADWGTVLLWEPPDRVAFTWHPGRSPDTAQEVEVTFRKAAGGTEVQLTHRGWEKLGPKAGETRAGYDSGWSYVLGECYAGAARTC